MFKPKTTISAIFASPKGGIERDGRLENSSGEWIYASIAENHLMQNTRFLWCFLCSGEWIRTTDLRVMSNAPESVPFVRRVLQISQTDERWLLLARHAAIVD